MRKIKIILAICLLFTYCYSQQKSNFYLSIGYIANNSIDNGFISSELDLGFQPKGSILIPSIGFGSLTVDPHFNPNVNIPENDFQFISANLELRLALKNNVRFKPYIGAKGSTFFLYNPTLQNQEFGSKNMLFILGPTIGFDFYIAKRFAINIGYSPQLELKSGFQNRISFGVKYGEQYYSEKYSQQANKKDRNNMGVNGVIMYGKIDDCTVSGYGVDLINWSFGVHNLSVAGIGSLYFDDKEKFWYQIYYSQTYKILSGIKNRFKPRIGWKIGYMNISNFDSSENSNNMNCLVIGPEVNLSYYISRKFMLYGAYSFDLLTYSEGSGYLHHTNIGFRYDFSVN